MRGSDCRLNVSCPGEERLHAPTPKPRPLSRCLIFPTVCARQLLHVRSLALGHRRIHWTGSSDWRQDGGEAEWSTLPTSPEGLSPPGRQPGGPGRQVPRKGGTVQTPPPLGCSHYVSSGLEAPVPLLLPGAISVSAAFVPTLEKAPPPSGST